MLAIKITVKNEHRPDLESFLSSRIYPFNCESTGITDGQLLNATVEDDDGNVIAAVSGHTWGGCCEVVNLWVDAMPL